ncbi:MAG: DUF6512 family protein [Eubacterium sp.]
MKNNLLKRTVVGFVFVSIAGSLFHFIFQWSGYNRLAGIFFPVNESIWEHLKLIYLPFLIWTIIEYYILKKDKSNIFPKAIGTLCGMATIVIFYYTYTGISGKNIEFLNIFSFFIGAAVAFAVDYLMIKSEKFKSSSTAGIIIFIITGAIFVVFTFAPPLIPLFRDPQSLTYGL